MISQARPHPPSSGETNAPDSPPVAARPEPLLAMSSSKTEQARPHPCLLPQERESPSPSPGEESALGSRPVTTQPALGMEPAHASRNTQHSSVPYIVLTGNPNSGKTTLFNALTGLRAKVGNYAGVTVERKEGRLLGGPAELSARVLDLPGSYSLSPHSLDEQISRDVLLSRLPELPAPALIVVVVDASNLQRNLYYATQVIELGYPTILALNMIDVAENNGHQIDSAQLAAALGVPVFPIVASANVGISELRK